MTGCLNQVAIRERRGLCSMAACVQVSLHVPNVALVAGVRKLLKSCHCCSGGGGGIRMSFFDSGGDEGEEDLHNDYG